MLSKCANPSCNAPFRRLRSGRLFQFEFRPPGIEDPKEPVRADGSVPIGKTGGRIERFWLCAHCAASMTLELTPEANDVAVVPIAQERRRLRAAAS